MKFEIVVNLREIKKIEKDLWPIKANINPKDPVIGSKKIDIKFITTEFGTSSSLHNPWNPDA